MRSATPIPEKPLLRNNSPAASMMRSRFAAACSRVTLITHLSYAAERDDLTTYMTTDINNRGHLSYAVGDCGCDGHTWCDDRAARARVRLERCADLLGLGASHPVVRPVRSVRRRFHEP